MTLRIWAFQTRECLRRQAARGRWGHSAVSLPKKVAASISLSCPGHGQPVDRRCVPTRRIHERGGRQVRARPQRDRSLASAARPCRWAAARTDADRPARGRLRTPANSRRPLRETRPENGSAMGPHEMAQSRRVAMPTGEHPPRCASFPVEIVVPALPKGVPCQCRKRPAGRGAGQARPGCGQNCLPMARSAEKRPPPCATKYSVIASHSRDFSAPA
ncbi:hypothetical protein SAMN06265378_103421 [Paracoccus sediminis]|uniref:Uncharacterized protein n=1 Tax=Paracoccus sediminis TaxID=1214787 RepID=A0A238W6S7_9RHOB|nr:hypothetical protein SAMN06265378_103421 [Paracoccus sediminis]